jgi:phospholipase C
MKPRQLFIDAVKRTTAVLTATAMFVGPAGVALANVRDDSWGTGVRVPAIIISPLARDGSIDHREYETVSILKLLQSGLISRHLQRAMPILP